MANLAVFGLGYVGTVTAACFATHGHKVIGVEANPSKAAVLRAGKSPLGEPHLDELVRKTVSAGALRTADDAEQAVAQSSVAFITVGTPSKRNGDVDLTALETVLQQIGAALCKHQHPYTVVLRSTVLPGTTAGMVASALLRASGRPLGKDLAVFFNPEFLREGTAVSDFFHPPFVVVGHLDGDSAPTLRELWRSLPIEAPVLEVRAEEAEMLKYACNAFHALKIVFANEMGVICQQLEMDAQRVMDAFVQDHDLNISERYLKPGFAYGGSCLPKDLQALMFMARKLNVDSPVLQNIAVSNDLHLARAVSTVLESGARRVAIIGLGFKAGTEDVRNSPAVLLCEQLIGKGIHVSIFDRNVVPQYLLGRNKEFLEAKLPHILVLLKKSVEEAVAGSDAVVICNPDPDLAEALASRGHHTVIDLTAGGLRSLPVAAAAVGA